MSCLGKGRNQVDVVKLLINIREGLLKARDEADNLGQPALSEKISETVKYINSFIDGYLDRVRDLNAEVMRAAINKGKNVSL